jgi:putative tryptophan/tyrosine transport system substrate-binding protein
MNRNLLWVLTVFLLSSVQPAEAQPAKRVYRIAVLSPRVGIEARDEIFREGLRELGYVEGQNIVIAWRFAEEKPERLGELAAELAKLNVEVIVTYTTPAIKAAMHATKTIPIVMANVGDPIARGFVVSLARPGGNVTGLTNLSSALGGKRLEILKEVLPKLSRVAVFWNPDAHTPALKELESDAGSLGVEIRPVDVRVIQDIDMAFETASKVKADGLLTLPNSLLVDQRVKVVSHALKKRLPAIYPNREIADAGGLMAYGPDINENYRRAAVYVDKILKGTKPADLPVEQPRKFELVINLKTAKQIGLTIPANVLARADKVIK